MVGSPTAKLQTSSLILLCQSLVLLFFYPPARDVFNFPKLWILTSFATAIFIHFLTAGKSSVTGHQQYFTRINFLLAFLILSIFASTFISDATLARKLFGYPGRYNGLIYYSCVVTIVFVTSRIVLSSNFMNTYIKYFIWTSLVFGGYGFIQFLNIDPIDWNVSFNRIVGTLGNPNFSGAFFALLCVTYGILFQNQSRNLKIVYLSLAIFFGLLAILTDSLQAPILIILGVCIYILMIAHKNLSRLWFTIIILIMTFFGSFALITFFGYGPLGSRFEQVTLELRMNYWRIGIEIAKNNLLFGIGPDSYVEGFRLYRGEEFVRQFSDSVISDSAHNTLINFFANFGLPAFLSLSVLVIVITKNAISLIFTKDEVIDAGKIIPISWVLLLAQSIISIEQIGLSIYHWIIGGLLLNPNLYLSTANMKRASKDVIRNDSNKTLRQISTELASIGALFVTILSFPFLREEVNLNRFNIVSNSRTSEDLINLKIEEFSDYSLTEIRRIVHIVNFLLINGRVNDAEYLLEELVTRDKDASEGFEILARISSSRGDRDRELLLRQRIEELDPYNYHNLLSLSQLYLNLNSQSKALIYAKKVLLLSGDRSVNDSATIIVQEIEG